MKTQTRRSVPPPSPALPPLLALALLAAAPSPAAETAPPDAPHIVLVMSDDQGWGQTGYYGHPHLRTPHLDEMAAAGLRFDRFYAGASNCSPARATVLTGRSNDRTGVFNHGYPLRLQERTIAQALKEAGYATAHFGKWHLNGLRGPGAPVLENDTHHPGAFGFGHWLSATNYFDRDPLLSRMGEFEEFRGDSSEIVVDEALAFLREAAPRGPTFTVIWYGTPHDPFIASEEDRAPFAHLPEDHQHHYGELVAMDRSIGALRAGLRELGVASNTLVWFCSDNGGLPQFGPETMGGLRGAKNTMYEGGLRVPAVAEWPDRIAPGRVTEFPAGTVDMFATLAEAAGIPGAARLHPQDGISLMPLFTGEATRRDRPLLFRHDGRGVLLGHRYKLMVEDGGHRLFDLIEDPAETTDLSGDLPEIAGALRAGYEAWNLSVEASVAGRDYPGGSVAPDQPERRFWHEDPDYLPHLETFLERPEYSSWMERRRGAAERGAAKGKGKGKGKGAAKGKGGDQ